MLPKTGSFYLLVLVSSSMHNMNCPLFLFLFPPRGGRREGRGKGGGEARHLNTKTLVYRGISHTQVAVQTANLHTVHCFQSRCAPHQPMISGSHKQSISVFAAVLPNDDLFGQVSAAVFCRICCVESSSDLSASAVCLQSHFLFILWSAPRICYGEVSG